MLKGRVRVLFGVVAIEQGPDPESPFSSNPGFIRKSRNTGDGLTHPEGLTIKRIREHVCINQHSKPLCAQLMDKCLTSGSNVL